MGSAASMNASIKANAKLRRKERLFTAVKKVNDGKSYKPVAKSKVENRKIRASKNEEIMADDRVRKLLGVVLGLPILSFIIYVGMVAISWLVG